MSECERFEAWTIDRYHGDRGDVLSRRPDGEYISGPMQFAFEAWQAALADRPAEEPEVDPWYGTGKLPMQRDRPEQPLALLNDAPSEAGAEPCRECSAVSAAIGSHRFMDPPDGGDVLLAEQVRRMRVALENAESILQALLRARDRGADPRLILDENSPLVDAIRASVAQPAQGDSGVVEGWNRTTDGIIGQP